MIACGPQNQKASTDLTDPKDLVFFQAPTEDSDLKSGFRDSLFIGDNNNRVYFDQTIPFDDFINQYDTLQIEGETFFVIQGDLLIDIDEMFDYYSTYYNDTTQYEKLVVDVLPNGIINKMPNADHMNYVVVRSSFPSEDLYNEVVSNMNEASDQWGTVLHGKVKLTHLKKLDTVLRPSQQHRDATFTVRYYNAGGKFIASAFFPHYLTYRWKIRVDPSYFNTRADKTGVFRHEIGHILGFRHEHIRKEAPLDCPRESDTTFDPVTSYDEYSLMHYPCGGFGDLQLKFTQRDIDGSRLIYY